MNDALKTSPSDSQAERLLRLVHWTSAASRHLRRRLAEVAESIGLSDSELLVVWLCCGDGRIQVELAGAIGISPGQMSGMVERLRSRGLVAMHRQAMDRRRQICRTTPVGQELLSCTAEHLNELAASVGASLSADEQQATQTLCERLSDAVKQKSLLAALLLLAVALTATGCSRTFYRRQADIDAYGLVREKATHPHWRLPNYTISLDPRSRMYDPYAIDCPPIPPDDSTAHQLMHCVDNKRGWPFWHDNGDRSFVENPAWAEYVNTDKDGVLRLNRDDAVRVALLNSREYQQQLETLYLSALDVSVERFRFDSQFFAGYSVFGTWTGPGVTGNSSSILRAQTQNRGLGGTGAAPNAGIGTSPAGPQFAMNKAFTTGGSLLVDFANSLVWQFSGEDNFNPLTIVNFTFVQPLLRGAGRDRVLEQLTLSERGLLYNVRIMEQYRQAFYVDTVVGVGTQGSTPNRLGGVGGQGLTGFSGVGATGFNNVVTQGGGGGTQPAQGANNSSFTGLLQQQRLIRNQEDAIRRLRRNLNRVNTLLDEQPSQVTGDYLTQALQAAQTRQALLTTETQLVTNRNQFQANVDQFKVNELSLPPQICVVPEDKLLDQFDLIDQEIVRLPEDWEFLLLDHIHVRREIPERIQANVQVTGAGNDAMCSLTRYPELDDDLLKLREALEAFKKFTDTIVSEHIPQIQKDIELLRATLPRRKAYFQRLLKQVAAARGNPCDLLPLGVDPLEAAGGETYPRDLIRQIRNSLPDEIARIDTPVGGLLAQVEGSVAPNTLGDGTAARELSGQLAQALAEQEPGRSPQIREMLEQLDTAISPEVLGAATTLRNAIWRLDRSLTNADRSYQNLGANFQRYAAEVTLRTQIVERLQRDRTLSPVELFEQLVRGVFSRDYECGKTRVLTIDVAEDISRELIELQLLQAVARVETIEMAEVDMQADWALDVARRYRRDWMNQRANLVDRWRRLQFQADQLQAGLDVFFNGSIQNVNDNVFSLRPNTGPLQLGVQFDAPITRLQERNAYRQSLIEYQQARRSYYNFEDGVAQGLRSQLRQLTSFQINFELNRLAVIEAARQVMLNTFINQETQRLGTVRATGGRDDTQAIQDLLNAQNNFMLIFISYEVQRLQLDFSLGTMQLDNEGLWIDPGKIGPEYGQYDPWMWRDTPGFAGHESMKHGEGQMEEPDKGIDQLPPPFLLPPGNQETIPPPAPEAAPRLPRPARER